MVGYACDDTPQLMPMPTVLAHRITRELSACRRSGYIKDIFSDGKAQVTVEYEDGKLTVKVFGDSSYREVGESLQES